MKRSRFYLLLLLGLGSICSYAVWCARPFYQYPSIRFGRGVSEQMQAYIVAWDADQRLYRPVEFTWRGWGYALCHPYEPGFKPVGVSKIGGGLFGDEEEAIISHPSRPALEVRRNRYGWETPIMMFSGPPGYVTRPPKWHTPERSEGETPASFLQPPPDFRKGNSDQ